MQQQMTYDKDEVDELILDALKTGGRTPGWLIENVDLPMSTSSAVGHRLKLLAAAGDVQNIGHGIYELRGGYVPARKDTTQDSNDNLRDLVESVEWQDVTVARTDARVGALTHVLETLQGNGAMSSSELREAISGFDLGITDSSVQRMLSDVLGQLAEVEGTGQRYRWVGR